MNSFICLGDCTWSIKNFTDESQRIWAAKTWIWPPKKKVFKEPKYFWQRTTKYVLQRTKKQMSFAENNTIGLTKSNKRKIYLCFHRERMYPGLFVLIMKILDMTILNVHLRYISQVEWQSIHHVVISRWCSHLNMWLFPSVRPFFLPSVPSFWYQCKGHLTYPMKLLSWKKDLEN